MDYNNIKMLLDKFWRCETTLEEESQIRIFFLDNPIVLSELKSDKAYFDYLVSQAKHPVLKEDLTSVIDFTTNKRKPTVISLNKKYLSYAAVLVPILCIMTYLIYQTKNQNKKGDITISDTFYDAKEAMTTAEKELLFVSYKLNEAASEIESIGDLQKELIIPNKH